MGNCVSDHFLLKTNDNIPLYSMNNKKFRAKIVDVYDGDTCTAIFWQNFKYRKYKIRMLGYDSPEMKPSLQKENREAEIEAAKLAKQALKDWVDNKIVILHCGNFDKYGRLLGTLYKPGTYCRSSININEWMIDNNYGYRYDGGTKKN